MESPEEAMASDTTATSSTDANPGIPPLPSPILKRKRTKRLRLLSSTSFSSNDSKSATDEDEDMANCLILLAQGPALDPPPPPPPAPLSEKLTSRRFAEAATTTAGKAGFYVYECKTCSKCFPSFQALGGHRTSHKKPKPAVVMDEDELQISLSSPYMRPVSDGGKPGASGKVHECAICGAGFSSGQALGGHMRRHRPVVVGGPPLPLDQGEKGKEGFLSLLDLNQPAPLEVDESTVFRAATNNMVDCYY